MACGGCPVTLAELCWSVPTLTALIDDQIARYTRTTGYKAIHVTSVSDIRELMDRSSVKEPYSFMCTTNICGRAFEDLEGVLGKMAEQQGQEWVHVSQEAMVAEHCRKYALSDHEEDHFRATCSHEHTESCEACQSLHEMFDCLEESFTTFSFASPEEQDEPPQASQAALQEERQKRLEAENRARDFETQLQACRTREAAVQRTLRDLTRNIERLQSQEEQHLREISLLKAKVRSKKNKQRNRRVRSHRKMRSNLSSSQLKPCGKRKRRETYKRRLFETFDSFHREVKKAKVELTLAGQDKPQHLTWRRRTAHLISVERELLKKSSLYKGMQHVTAFCEGGPYPPPSTSQTQKLWRGDLSKVFRGWTTGHPEQQDSDMGIGHGPVAIEKTLTEEKLGGCRQTVATYQRKLKAEGAVIYPRPGISGIAKLQVIHLDFIDACMRENDEYTSPDLQKLLIDGFGLSVACSTIRRHRYLIGWIKSGPRYCQVIRPQNREKRQEWSQRMLASGENFANPHIEHTCNAATLPELEHAITKSFNPSPVSFHIQNVLDFKTWLSSELEDISGHSIPHCFKFTMGPHQQPNIHYKEYSTECKNSWYSLSTPPPDSNPISHVIPSPIKHLEAIHDGIQKARSMSRLTGDQNDWWEDFISSLQEEYQPPEVVNPLSLLYEYIMPDSQRIMKKMWRARHETTPWTS
ncbi:hypothetical protein Bbelb_283060 [Branchiostoma belcheri]|nr:hypothetical protein Bbelb_283060 [Branchiostoma belcheri]